MTRTTFIVILLAILAYGLAVRCFDLTADSPAYFGGGGQDLTTDGPYLTLYTKTAVQHGEWNPLGYVPWAQFKISAVSAVSYVLFLLFGASRFTANLTGVLLSLAGIVLFLVGLSRSLSRGGLIVTATLLATSYLLVLFGRVPFAENGLICLAGAAYLVYSFWFDRTWGKILLGILLALVALLGKTFGSILLAGPLVYLLVTDRKHLPANAALIILPLVVCTLAFSLAFYRGSDLLSFLYEHGIGEHGTPYGVTSLPAYIETIISFGRIGIYKYGPVESIGAFLLLLIAITYPRREGHKSSRLLVFMVSWLVVWILVLAPFSYRPARYAIPMILPLAALAGLAFDRFIDPERSAAAPVRWWRVLLLLLLIWHMCFTVSDLFIQRSPDVRQLSNQVWVCLPVALALTLLWLAFSHRRQISGFAHRRQNVLIGIIAVAALATQWHFLYPWYSNATHTIDEANRDMPVIVSPGAVVAGQYGPALSQSNSLRGFPLFITPHDPQVLKTLRTYPITHVAVPAVDWDSLTAGIPELKGAPIISRYWLRDGAVYLVRVTELFNKTSSQYPLSAYEQALNIQVAGNRDRAMKGLFDIVKQYPFAKSPSVELYYLAADPRNLVALHPLIDSLVTSNSTDFTVNLIAAVYYKFVYQIAPSQFSPEAADMYRRRAIELSPDNETAVNREFLTYTPTDRVLQ